MLGLRLVIVAVIFNFIYLDLVSYVLMLSVFIPIWVFVMLAWQVLSEPNICLLDNEDNVVELVWTVVPTLFVLVLCFFNLQCLGSDYYRHVLNVVKVIGRQWYWEYELEGSSSSYDSFMTDFVGCVDKPLRVAYLVPQCLLITSADVIHSFAVPSLGLKCDAVPGRVNQITFTPDRLGVFVGYCSELCGAGHAYMPIVVEVVKSVVGNKK